MKYTHKHKRNWGYGLEYLLSLLSSIEMDLKLLPIVHAGDGDKLQKLLSIKSHQLHRIRWAIHEYTYEVRYGFDYGRELKPNHENFHDNKEK